MSERGMVNWWRAALAFFRPAALQQPPTVASLVAMGNVTPLSDWLPLGPPEVLGSVSRIAHVTNEDRANSILANGYIGGALMKANFSTCWSKCSQAEQFGVVLIFGWSGSVGMGSAAAPSGSELYHSVSTESYVESWIAHGQATGLELVAIGCCSGKKYSDCEVVSVVPAIPIAVEKLR